VSFFPQAFAIVVGEEGGYIADPRDPGGETKYGISKRTYPNVDIAQLTLEEAREIYLRDYWNACACDTMSWERALCVFDMAVNQGQGAARALNLQTRDVGELMAERALRYAANKNFAIYGKGWLNRLFKVFKVAQITPQ
jgi:lysozyme family protein